MLSIQSVISWFIVHWKTLGATAIVTAVGGFLMWISIFRKNKAERLLAEASLRRLQREEQQQEQAELKREQARRDYYVRTLAGRVLMWMDVETKQLGTASVVISEH